jgi:hypothetical protein
MHRRARDEIEFAPVPHEAADAAFAREVVEEWRARDGRGAVHLRGRGPLEGARALRVEQLNEFVIIAGQPLDELAAEKSGRAGCGGILREADGLIPERVIFDLLLRARREAVERDACAREIVALVGDVDALDDGVNRELARGQRRADDDERDDREAGEDRARRPRSRRTMQSFDRDRGGRSLLRASCVGRDTVK